MTSLDDKRAVALDIINGALKGAPSFAALIDGGPAGVVMLSLIRQATTLTGLLALFTPGADTPYEVCRFADKLRRLWGFDMVTCRTGEGAASLAVRYGVSCLFTPATEAPDGGCVSGRDGFVEVRPLCGFGPEDISGLVKAGRLPVCSLDAGVDAVRYGSPDDLETAVRLKGLGYL